MVILSNQERSSLLGTLFGDLNLPLGTRCLLYDQSAGRAFAWFQRLAGRMQPNVRWMLPSMEASCGLCAALLTQLTSLSKLEADLAFTILQLGQLHLFVCYGLDCSDSGVTLPNWRLGKDSEQFPGF